MRHSLLSLIIAFSVGGTAIAQQVPPATIDAAQQQLQQMLKKKNTQESIGQAMALGILVNCTQKTAGKEATQAFYQEMQGVGEKVRAACKRQDGMAAQQIVLTTLDAKKNDPVLKGALNCYDTQQSAINGIAGQKTAEEVAYYAGFARDPVRAHQEMKPTDICRERQHAAQ